jgi:phosphohistidine swiveling domain-containing protein
VTAPFVATGADALSPQIVGGKAANLARMRDAGVAVPAFVALRADAAARLASPAQTEGDASPEAAFRAEVLRAVGDAGLAGRLLAVRSSAVGEDAEGASYAGQFRTVLGVRAEGDGAALFDAIRDVWASAESAHAAAYRARGGERDAVRMGVVVQEMADASAAGVAFSADPVSGARDVAVVSAVHGLGEGLVSGEMDADAFRISLAGEPRVVSRTLAAKEAAIRLRPDGGTETVPLPPHLSAAPAITDGEAIEVARAAAALAERFGAPQDVEWAYVGGGEGRRLVLLQSRPITTLPASLASPSSESETGAAGTEGERRIWDNSNIIESYSGVTTPLTFSFARGVYEEVYVQFCRLMGVSEALLEANRPVFAHMLGLIRGRVYYNLLNWYRVLSLLPGYAFNRAFMERMMGVREKLADPPPAPPVAGRLADLGRMIRMGWRLVRAERGLRRGVPAFHAHVDRALSPLAGADLAAWPADDLHALYRRLEDDLLRNWRTPLVNDFFAMIFFGVLGRLTESWLPGAPATLANDLLCGEGGIVSTEPAKRVMALAAEVRRTPAVAALFAAEPDDARLWARLETADGVDGFRERVRAYLDRFGDRCMNELKLETVTLGEDPAFLLRMVRAYAAQGETDPAAGHAREAQVRADAEAQVRARLSGPRRAVYFAVLRRARMRVRDRENLRFERTRVFGTVRRIFVALGGHLARAGRLETGRDVFWLRTDEVFAHLTGTGVSADLRAIAAARREEFARWERTPPPPDRFETRGPPADALGETAAAAAVEGDLRGTGCCPGVVRAPVRVVRDPREARDLAGHILVAERTDPGWTLLFPAVVGLLVQRGSLLSHSAIVAREMALPCVVAIPGLMETLRDGEVVEMDGATGVVRRIGTEGDA